MYCAGCLVVFLHDTPDLNLLNIYTRYIVLFAQMSLFTIIIFGPTPNAVSALIVLIALLDTVFEILQANAYLFKLCFG